MGLVKKCNSRHFSPKEYTISEQDFLRLDVPRPLGLTGHMRVRNEEMTLQASLDSCIDFLDELIITYNDSQDNTESILLAYAQKYPQKIRLYWYPLEEVTRTQHTSYRAEHAEKKKNTDQKILFPLFGLANFYNFGYVKTSYSHYMKIDADQVYFTKKMVQIKNEILTARKSIPSSGNVPINACRFSRFSKKIVNAIKKRAFLFFAKKCSALETIQIYKRFFPYEKDFFNLSGVNVIYGKNCLCLPDSFSIFNGGCGDHFISSPNSTDRYVHTERYEVFTCRDKISVHLGLGWIHTGGLKRNQSFKGIHEICLAKIHTISWKALLSSIDTSSPNVQLHMAKPFWDEDIMQYFTDDFYIKYFPAIEDYYHEHIK